MNARLHHNGRSQGCVGIDIGGTKIEGVLLDATDRVIDVCRMPSHSGESNVVTDIASPAYCPTKRCPSALAFQGR
jgi:glucokinase